MNNSESNPYTPPISLSHRQSLSEQTPTIQEALARGYDFGVDNVINQAWAMVKGSKGLIISSYLLMYAALPLGMMGLAVALSALDLLDTDKTSNSFLVEQLFNLLSAALTYPFLAGIYLIGIRRAAEQSVSINLVFSQFNNFWPLFVTGLLMTMMIAVGFMLLVVPGIYLSIAYLLAIPLVAERGLSPWQALETSRKAINQHWFKVFGLFFTLGLITLVSIIPLGIGLIWTLPLITLSIGVLYRIIFGVQTTAN